MKIYRSNQLLEPDNAVLRRTAYNEHNPKTYMTIIDDDGNSEVWTILKAISEEKGIPFTISLHAGSELTQDQVLYLQNTLNFEVASHGLNHVDLTTLTGAALITEVESSKNAHISKGYNCQNMVYPYGGNNLEVRNTVSKYFNCAARTSTADINNFGLDSFQIDRIALGSFTAVGEDTYAFYKSKLDEAIAANGWAVYMTHCWDAGFDATQQQHLKDLIDYALANGVEIVTLQTGYEVFGNQLQFKTGFDQNVKIAKDGTIYSDQFRYNFTSVLLPDALQSAYQDQCVTVAEYSIAVAQAHGLPTGGILETYTFGSSADYVYQLFYPYNSNHYYKRRWLVASTAWGALEEFYPGADNTAKPVQILALNAHVATDLITTYPANCMSIMPVNIAGGSGFPTDYAGTVTTHRIGGNGWDYQEFKRYGNWDKYVRYVDGAGAWSAWKQYTVV